MTNLLFILAAAQAASPSFSPPTQRVLSSYGACLARESANLEVSGDPAQDVITASVAACRLAREAALEAISSDLRTRKDQYQTSSATAPERALGVIEQKMRENVLLQIIQRRAARASAKH